MPDFISAEQRIVLSNLENKVDALAGEATPAQVKHLQDWIYQTVAPAYFNHAAEIILPVDSQAYTDMRMRMGEMGL